MEQGVVLQRRSDFEWKIPEFFSLLDNVDVQEICSPEFRFSGFTYNLHLYIFLLRRKKREGIRIRITSLRPRVHYETVYCTFGVQKSDCAVVCTTTKTLVFRRGRKSSEVDLVGLRQKDLRRHNAELVPSKILTIVFSMGTIGLMQSSDEEVFQAPDPYAPSPEGVLPSPAPQMLEHDTSSPAELLPRSSELKGKDGLASDFKKLLLSGEVDSDANIRVNGQDIPVHSLCLMARSPVFLDMFRHRKKSASKSMNVVIENCEAATFRTFLQYVYTGSLDDLTVQNVMGVYQLADEYQVPGLKEECMECIRSGLSIESFCYVFPLALKPDSGGLSSLLMDFFAQNVDKITESVEWKVFCCDNHTQAEQLLTKSLKVMKKIKRNSQISLRRT